MLNRFAPILDSLSVQEGHPSASLTAVGDMAFATSAGAIPENVGQFVDCVEPLLGGSDVRIGNLETTLTNAQKADQSIGSLLSASPNAVAFLVGAKMDVVSLANNHARDCGIVGLVDCCELLHGHGIQYCGAGDYSSAARSPAVFQKAGLKIAVLGYCDNYRIDRDAAENQAPVSARDDRILNDIRCVRPHADLVVIQLHWGWEFAFPPLISYRDRARAYAEAGADLVLCHHAHLFMGVEVWRKSIVSHGLGNFVFPRSDYVRAGHPWTNRSYALKVFVNASGVLRADVVPFVITTEGLPAIATGSARREILGALTKASLRLSDDHFLGWLEHDRTLRVTVDMVSSFLKSAPPIDREIALQLHSPFKWDCIERLRNRYGKSGERVAHLLSDMAEAAVQDCDFKRFARRQRRELQTAFERLNTMPPLSNDLAGRLP